MATMVRLTTASERHTMNLSEPAALRRARVVPGRGALGWGALGWGALGWGALGWGALGWGALGWGER